jgi:hypothetical protein
LRIRSCIAYCSNYERYILYCYSVVPGAQVPCGAAILSHLTSIGSHPRVPRISTTQMIVSPLETRLSSKDKVPHQDSDSPGGRDRTCLDRRCYITPKYPLSKISMVFRSIPAPPGPICVAYSYTLYFPTCPIALRRHNKVTA